MSRPHFGSACAAPQTASSSTALSGSAVDACQAVAESAEVGCGERFGGWTRRPSISLDDRRGPGCRAARAAAPGSPTARCGGISRTARGGRRFRKRCDISPGNPIEAGGRRGRACSAVGTAARRSPPGRCGGTSLNARNVQRFLRETCSCSVGPAVGFCHEAPLVFRRTPAGREERGVPLQAATSCMAFQAALFETTGLRRFAPGARLRLWAIKQRF